MPPAKILVSDLTSRSSMDALRRFIIESWLPQPSLAKKEFTMICRTCIELESSLLTARQPVAPDALLGLTPAGERNRIQQKQEKVLKIEGLLAKHKLVCKVE